MIDDNTTRKIARLSRIAVTDAEVPEFTRRLNGVMNWVDMLQEVDTSNVEPLASVIQTATPQREDVVSDGGYADKVLANAPETKAGFFVVPKVVE